MIAREEIVPQYEDIAPYNQQEIEEALNWLSDNELFMKGVQYFYPKWTHQQIIQKLQACNSCADFQVTFIEPMIRWLIDTSIDNLTITGLETIKKEDSHLYISNHRDIFLDSGLLQYTLYHKGYDFTEISLGNNLIVNDVMERVAKLNNMFTVFRDGSKLQKLKNAKNLSAYLRHAITEKKVSAWIAQGNGRSKDGNDRTFPGLINMLMMSAKEDLKSAVAELNIVVSSVSFEYEPCALEKAVELQTKEDTGEYKKATYENIHSIVKGIKEYKGDVSLSFEKLDVENINFTGNNKEDIKGIANEIDRLVHKNYKLFKTNYIAHDLLFDTNSFKKHYTKEEKESFNSYIKANSDDRTIRLRLLKMYVNPMVNKKLL